MSKYQPAEIRSESGELLAKVAGLEFGQPSEAPNLKRFTAFIIWQDADDMEEIDVDAKNAKLARECVKLELAQGYEPGGKIKRLEERFGLYM